MSRSQTLLILPLLVSLPVAACGVSHPPVPMVGNAADVSALIGKWAGDYSSAESGRAGSIAFTLSAAGDSAFGDVVMVPNASGIPLQPWRPPEGAAVQSRGTNQAAGSTVLKIRFVRVESGHVSGTLDAYADPQTGSRLLTTFSGELKGDSITGSYTTRLASGDTQTGRWSVERR
jgi:hypothetical protein